VDTTGKTIDLSMEISSTALNLALQIDCVPGNPCSAYYLEDGSRSLSTLYPVNTPATRLRVRAFGSILPSRMVQAEWSVQFSGDPATTLFQANAEWLDIIVPSDATSIQLYASALYDPPQEPAPELPPATRFSINFDNQCVDYVDSADVLIGVPRESDLFLAPTNRGSFPMGTVLDSDDPRLIFTSLTGRQMSAFVEQITSPCLILDKMNS
jgi:hypothetical protein